MFNSVPFTIRPLGAKLNADASAAAEDGTLTDLLPASYRPDSGKIWDNVVTPRNASNVIACLETELDVRRLHAIHGWLWIAGRPLPPRPLHFQRLLRRELVVVEQMDMHLVWTTGQIALKPLPRFLLEPSFWTTYLICPQACSCLSKERPSVAGSCRSALRACALGFLFSYAALIEHESDYHLAIDKKLIPQEIRWQAWRVLVQQLVAEHMYENIDRRFFYGELFLSRLNLLYRFTQGEIVDGYMPRWTQYGSFLWDQFTWLASATIFIAIVLSAMQVGLAVDVLGSNPSFQAAAHSFSIFALLAPSIGICAVVFSFLYLYVYNWFEAKSYKEARLSHLARNTAAVQEPLTKPATSPTRVRLSRA
jgi:hypothetical protein